MDRRQAIAAFVAAACAPKELLIQSLNWRPGPYVIGALYAGEAGCWIPDDDLIELHCVTLRCSWGELVPR